MHFKSRQWIVPSLFTQYVGYQNVVSKKYFESVGEQKAGDPSDRHRPLPPRRRQAGRLSPLRGGAGPLAQDARSSRSWSSAASPSRPPGCPGCARARSTSPRSSATSWSRRRRPPCASTRIANAAQYWVIMTGQTTPDREDYCPTVPVGGRSRQREEPRERAGRCARPSTSPSTRRPSSAGSGRARAATRRTRTTTIRSTRATARTGRSLRTIPSGPRSFSAEAGHGGGFEVRVNPYVQLVAQDGPDVMEAVALDWEKIGIKVKRVPEADLELRPQGPHAEDGQDVLRLWLAALRRAGGRLGARAHCQGRLQPARSTAPTTRRSKRRCGRWTPTSAPSSRATSARSSTTATTA